MPGFWGGGFNFNNRVSPTGSSGQQTIHDAEYDHDYRYLPENGPFHFQTAFTGASPFTPFITPGGGPVATGGRTDEQKRADYNNCMKQAADDYHKRNAAEDRANAAYVAGYNPDTGDGTGAVTTVTTGLANKLLRKAAFRAGALFTITVRFTIASVHALGYEMGSWEGYKRDVAECVRKAQLP
jgi:hypothetical protein